MPTRKHFSIQLPAHYARWREGYSDLQSRCPKGATPRLAGQRYLNRLEQVLIRFNFEQTDAMRQWFPLTVTGGSTEYVP